MEQPSPAIEEISPKSRLAVALFAWFLGVFGVHRFYLGKIGTGIAMILTMGGLGIWAIIDNVLIVVGSLNDSDGKPLRVEPITGEVSEKSRTTAILLSQFLGSLGVDRFFLGYTGLGVLKLLQRGVSLDTIGQPMIFLRMST